MLKIFDYLNKNLIYFLNANSIYEVLSTLTENISKCGILKDEQKFFNAIIEREKLISTGIGIGVAVPHAKLAEYDKFFIAIGILQKGVDWNSLDKAPVRLVFMIGGPDDKQTEYLRILAALIMTIKDEKTRKKILTQNSQESIMEIFKAL